MKLAGLSVIVITKNEAARIERCLRSVDFADEIVVLDSGSSDDTVEIARRCGARVAISDDWPGFGVQKNRVLDMACGPWILSIDADEEVDERLREAIVAVVRGSGQEAGGAAAAAIGEAMGPKPRSLPACNGYWIARRSCFRGHALRFGDWRGDRVLRLFRKDAGRFTDVPIHEQVQCAPPLGRLDGLLMHYTVDSLPDAFDKAQRYAQAGAPRLAGRGRGGTVSAALHAAWTFLRGYLLRGGFLDGRDGLLLAAVNARGTWLRYRIAGRLRRRDGTA